MTTPMRLVHLVVGTENAAALSVKQELMFVGREEDKFLAFRTLIQEDLPLPVPLCAE